MRKSSFFLITLTISTTVLPQDISPGDVVLQEQRQVFKTAYRKAQSGIWPDSEQDLAVLSSYPLYPDLRAAYLSARVGRIADGEIESFLSEHSHYSFVRSLRYRWARSLASRENWSRYLDVYNDRYLHSGVVVLDCTALTARIKMDAASGLPAAAMELWMVGTSQPKECDPAFAYLEDNGHIKAEHRNRRMRMGIDARDFTLAMYLARSLGTNEEVWTRRWDRAHHNPSSEIRRQGNSSDQSEDRAILGYAFERLATVDPELAMDWWPQYRVRFDFDAGERARISRLIALRAAHRHVPEARVLLRNLPPDAMNDETAIWWTRLAIRQRDWNDALKALGTLSPAENARDIWRYWRARSLEAQGFEYASEQLFMQLATERGYYGFMAADRMGVAYQFQHESTAVDESMLLEIAARTDLVRAREWFLVGMHSKGRTEWARAVHGLDPTERVHATVLAHRWGWHSRAIATAAQSGLMDDLTIRYPTSVVDWFESTAATSLADSALILGVARTESLFMPDVGSSAGALGLMQIMPATGRRTARELNLRYRGRATLLDPYSNVRLGSHYLGHLLERFAENPVLATAAYNAGPHRVERWLPEGTVLPADVWIDTIPFRETRRYVRRVLTSQAIFRWRMDGSLHRITTSMPPVPPRHLLESVAGGNAGESSL